MADQPGQGTLFEEGYLEKTAGSITKDPDFALTELVANAWDAGATRVQIRLAKEFSDTFSISDNGHGMTRAEFENRWLCLGYSRSKHQGPDVEFPPEVEGKRKAFGKNGVGRHAMFCFSDSYKVETRKSGTRYSVNICIAEGTTPWEILSQEQSKSDGHGTTLSCQVAKHLIEQAHAKDLLAARFFHDPLFSIFVDGDLLTLERHPGVSAPETLEIKPYGNIKVTIVDSQKNARNNSLQGFTFRVNNRLVGEPSWIIDPFAPIDGRTAFGRRFSILVECDFMNEDGVEADWSGLKRGPKRYKLFGALNDYAIQKYRDFSLGKIEETKKDAFEKNIESIRQLPENQKYEVDTFVSSVVQNDPTIDGDALSKVVSSFVSLQNTRTGKSLLEKLAGFEFGDYEALERLLSEWSVQDALVVLEEIDRRLSVIRTIEILAGQEDTDELYTLHPLVSEARWLFGPEFESSEYVSNQTLKNAVNKVFGVQTASTDYPNWRKRPDLVLRPESSVSVVGLEEFQDDGLVDVKRVLIIELKKGKSAISRAEIFQGEGYAEQMRSSGFIQSKCWYDVFVVGFSVTNGTSEKTLSEDTVSWAKVRGVPFSRLTETANRRLLRLKEKLTERYHDDPTIAQSSTLKALLAEKAQTAELPFEQDIETNVKS